METVTSPSCQKRMVAACFWHQASACVVFFGIGVGRTNGTRGPLPVSLRRSVLTTSAPRAPGWLP